MKTAAEALVVDASVAAKWHLKGEVYNDQAQLLLARLSRGETALAAPSQIRFEVPSAITAATLGAASRLSVEEGQRAITEFLSLPLVTYDGPDLILDAYTLVHQYGIALYDALYFALAQQLDVRLITADRRLHRRIRHLPNVLWLGDYSLPPAGDEQAGGQGP
ncbi:MAG: type II toxin-antitoxin system VapC family toxin [Chloroflexota bacterium]